ncbi:MAG TPA: hypothetical protein VH592_25640 [Gemmataceae bacterium]|jgi:hypothetical protein
MSVRPIRIFLPAAVLFALVILAECFWLRSRQQAQHIAWANERVEERIATARGHLSEQHWNEAIRELEDALDVEEATNHDAIRSVLEAAQSGQAEALLNSADNALAHRHPNEALRLLRAYLAHPRAGNLDRARLLRDDLQRAFSDDEATQLLASLSDEALKVFAETGQLTVHDEMHTEAARFFFQDTLRRNLAKEIRKREAHREVARLSEERRAAEQVRRIARLRAVPAFLSLSTFLRRIQEQVRDQQQLFSRQEAELADLFQALGVKSAAEREQYRADLLERQNPADMREQIERKRADVKHSYRSEPGFNRADGELFDQLVDQEVDTILKALPSS